MDKIKVMAIFGTRPEAIKMAPLIKKLKECSLIDTKICITAQHREMLDQVLELFNIEVDYDLNIMKKSQSLTNITTNVLKELDNILEKEKPDLVLVHGDTTTTFAATLASFYKEIKIGHVEAGLRTFDKYFPYPEEMNRKLTGAMADLHFAPTKKAKQNLLNEGIKEENIFITGNTVIDAMNFTVQDNYRFEIDELNSIDYKNKKVIMVTAHRRENWGNGIENICKALKEIVHRNTDVELVYLVHLNPIVRNVVEKYLKGVERVHLLDPLDTRETHNLMNKCYMVMTDSGGIQEEAPHLGKPVLVLRNVTERPEAVEAGTVELIGTDYENIIRNADILINNKVIYEKMSNAVNPYGDGKASERIVETILYNFNLKQQKPQEFNQNNRSDTMTKKLCIVGLGYIGLPTASMFASNGNKVVGVDVNEKVIKALNKGEITIEEPGLEELVKKVVDEGNLTAQLKPCEAEYFIISVPTPITKDKKADMKYVIEATKSIVPYVRKGNTVILESTSPTGTTEKIMKPILEKSGLKVGEDLYLGHSPERVLPGRILYELVNNNRIIGGINRKSAEKIKELYSCFVRGEMYLTNATTAELCKMMENTYRDVNIALANELAKICEEVGINAWEVIDLCNKHPRVNIHKPGPGVGGHCLAVDPWFIVERVPELAKIIRLSRETNDSMPNYVFNKIEKCLLNVRGKKKVTILGITYKPNIDDLRESPILKLVDQLEGAEYDISLVDPNIKEYKFLENDIGKAVTGSDIVVLGVNHDEFKTLPLKNMKKLMRGNIILDTRNFLNKKLVEDAGFEYLLLGNSYDNSEIANREAAAGYAHE